MLEKSEKLSKIIFSTRRTPLGEKVISKLNSLAEKPKVSFLDFTLEDTSGNVVFTGLQAKSESPYTDGRRTAIKLASFLQKTLDLNQDEARTYQEILVTKILKTVNKDDVVKVLSGEDIRWGYLSDNYVPQTVGNIRSCMSGPATQCQLDLYCFNKNIQLLVNLVKGKVAARALLFNALADPEDENFIKVLGRIYSTTVHSRTQLDLWSKDNVDFYMDGTDVYACKSKKHTDNVFVPLDCYKVNAVPYLDNLTRLAKYNKNIYLTNSYEPRRHVEFPFIPAGGFPHPTDDTLLWSAASSGVWIKKSEAVKVNGYFYLKSEVYECEICKSNSLKANKKSYPYYKGGHLCAECKPRSIARTGILYAKTSELNQCKGCRLWGLKDVAGVEGRGNIRVVADDYCTDCIKNIEPCASKCGVRLLKTQMSLVDIGRVCRDCFAYGNYRMCGHCARYTKNSVAYKKQSFCRDCRGRYSGEEEVQEEGRRPSLDVNIVRVTVQ
jgi:hypothetical protein